MTYGRLPGMESNELEERLSAAEHLSYEIEDVRGSMQLVGEALQKLARVLRDVVGATDGADMDEYEDDLDRLDQIGHLIQ